MRRRPKEVKYSINMDQVRRSVATSTAIETGEPSGAIETRLKSSQHSAEGGSNSEGNKALPTPDKL